LILETQWTVLSDKAVPTKWDNPHENQGTEAKKNTSDEGVPSRRSKVEVLRGKFVYTDSTRRTISGMLVNGRESRLASSELKL